MNSFFEFVLDFLAEFVGGRGNPINNLPRFGSAIFFWGILLLIAAIQQKKSPFPENKLLFYGFLIGLLCDMFKLIMNSMELEGNISSLSEKDRKTLEIFTQKIDNDPLFIGIILFGSALHSDYHHDIDIALISTNPPISDQEKLKIILSSPEKFDVRFLEDFPLNIAKDVIRGKLMVIPIHVKIKKL